MKKRTAILPEHSENNQSLLDIVKGRNEQKKSELYEISQAKELLLIGLNLCILAAWGVIGVFFGKSGYQKPFS